MEADEDLRRLAETSALVLLYHGAWTSLPSSLARDLHNVPPALIRSQLERIGRYFRWVDIDTLGAMPDPRGHAAVTFDDGYRSVFEEALPVFEALGIPFTVYLNGAFFEGAVFWRDKVRLVQSMGWVEDFESFMEGIDPPASRRFYRYTKDPGIASERVDAELDRYLAHRRVAPGLPRHCVDDIADLPRHELVSYGNHGHHHYVMSSLDRARQAEEVGRTDDLLATLDGRRVSRWFSVPFGDVGDFDRATTDVIAAAGYRGVLLSRSRVHVAGIRIHGVDAIERFMPAPRPDRFWPAATPHA